MATFTIDFECSKFNIFLDTADVEEIASRYETGMIDGVTTNPSLILKSGKAPHAVISELSNLYPEMLSISAEPVQDNFEDIVREGLDYYTYGNNVTIKVPCTVEGLKACKYLSQLSKEDGRTIQTNVTLVFSVAQAIMAAKAGATYVSPFVGRCNDNSFSGVELIRAISNTYRVHGVETKILAASLRDVHHVSRCFAAGADVVTLPPKVFDKMYDHVLTREGLDIFQRDYDAALHQQRLAQQQDL